MRIVRTLLMITAGNFIAVAPVAARNEGHKDLLPSVHYVLKVDITDLSGYEVQIQLRNVPHELELAMATHHEYDDRFWRFIRNFRVDVPGGKANYRKKDSALWDISIPGHEAVISYCVQLPDLPRFAHRPFLSLNGGLVGDMHSFMYWVGHTQLPCRVTFELPPGWQIASGLEPTGDGRTLAASSAKMLLDCPVLVGQLHRWTFREAGIPHTVIYLSDTSVLTFDTARLVASIRKIAGQTIRLFGGMPYKRYTFLLEDGVYGALEHGNSLTVGAPASWLSGHMEELFEELAHEFCHTWNLMSIQPAGYAGLNYGPQERSAGLWFSEGLAMFYADLLVRRAGLPGDDSTRIAHLQSLIGRYYADTGNTIIPPGMVSLASNALPGLLGDYTASVHLQGELLGAMLDLLIRSATEGRRSFDDVMRIMYARFSGRRGFSAQDIEQAVRDVSGSDKIHSFFQNYIYDGKTLDFAPYLALIGLQYRLTWQPARNGMGQPRADARVYIWQEPGETVYRMGMTNPGSCWARAGLHTGDVLVSINGQLIEKRKAFYDRLGMLQIGDTALIGIMHSGVLQKIPVIMSGYETPVVSVIRTGKPDKLEQKLFQQWEERSN